MKIKIRKTPKGWCVDRSLNGVRKRSFFPSKGEAEAEADTIREQYRTAGEDWLSLSPGERVELMKVHAEVKASGLRLVDVWQEYRRISRPMERKRIGESIAEMEVAKRKANRRDRYVTELCRYVSVFARGRESNYVDEITTKDIEEWFRGRKEALVTQASSVTRFRTWFLFCIKKGWLVKNPCDGLEEIHVQESVPKILTPEQIEKVIQTGKANPAYLAWLTLALFVGVRPEEIDLITWDDVDLAARTLTISAEASKVRKRRIVPLSDTAKEWLQFAQKKNSRFGMSLSSKRRFVVKLRASIGLKRWPQDVLRHTAASYLLALHQDAGRVATMLGNSVSILHKHYKGLVTPEQCAAFWGLRP